MTKVGFNAGINNPEKHAKVERLGWAWKGARKNAVEKHLNALGGAKEARKTADRNESKLRKHEPDPKKAETTVTLVFAHQGDLGKLAGTAVFKSPDQNADVHELEIARQHIRHVPIGLVVVLLDRENKKLIAHARPWVLQEGPLKVLEAVVKESADLKGGRVQ